MNRDLLLTLGLLTTAALFLPPVLEAQGRQIAQVRCSNNLRQIGLAAVQYGDDKRYLPHVVGIRDLDGDVESNHSAVKLRALMWYGYLDSPAAFVCPSSDDLSLPVTDEEVRENLRKWHWEQGANPNPNTPPWRDAASDPKGSASREFSYGLTRRGYNRNVRSNARIGADRAIRDGFTKGALAGNHDEGWNVLNADCTVNWTPYAEDEAKFLVSTERGGGFLAIRDQAESSEFKPLSKAAPAPTPFAGWYRDERGATLVVTASEWSKRSQTWGVRGKLEQGAQRYDLAGRTKAGGFAGHIGSPGGPAAFTASADRETLSLEVAGKTHTFKRTEAPLPPLDRRLKNMVATGLVVALKTRNLEAAKAFLTPAALAKNSAQDLAKLSEEVASKKDRELGRYVVHYAALVVRSPDGVARVDLGSKALEKERQGRSREAAAIGALKILATAQTLFREGDKDRNGVLDYAGSIEDLGKAKLIDSALASGEKQGYRFVVCRGSKAPEFLWLGLASPKEGTQGRYLAINQAGVVYYRTSPFELDSVSCEIKGGTPVGR